MANYIFHDPTGRRDRRARLGVGLLVSLAALIVAGFFATLAFAPLLPQLSLKDPRVLQALHVETAHRLRGRPGWTHVPRRPNAGAPGGATRPLSVGFYVSWDESSLPSLAAHIDQLDVVSPQWIFLNGSLGPVTVTSDPRAEAVIASAKTAPSVLPSITNAHDGLFDGQLADNLLVNPAARTALVTNLVNVAKNRGYGGYIFDLENLSPQALAQYPGLVAQARAALKPLGREVWVTAPFANPDWNLKTFQSVSDTIVLMAYDEHWGGDAGQGGGQPGPPASQDWYEANLEKDVDQLDPARMVVALGDYGYDWTLDKTGKATGGETEVFYDATQNAKDSEASVSFDDDALNPTYGYINDDGSKHVVWFLDAATVFNEIKIGDVYRPRGYALWRMGAEDPSVWKYFHQPYGSAKPTGLETISPGTDVKFDGKGEVLHVSATPTPGQRHIELDPDNGLISTEDYKVMPTSYVVQRYGWHPGWVALTFDDGPDGRWTPKILDILRQKHATATFFTIGDNVQVRPDLVQREVREGDIVGNHTWTHPNIGETPVAQTDLELNTTQRLFEVLTGKSMRLFRPPYFGDAEPSTPNEVAPLLLAQKLGYLIVGLRIDPDDWQREPNGRMPAPDVIIQRVMDRLDDTGPRQGQVVLLHDAGGDRSQTVAALPKLIDAIRARGLKLVTVDELAGMTPAQAMPPTSRSSVELWIDRLGFGFFRYVDVLLRTLFITAIILGVARLFFLAVLALRHRFTAPGRAPPMLDPATGPMVSVLIPCFNEEKVIVASVARILHSNWSRLEVLVLDDGSSDATAARVREAFADEPRVTLLTFPNGGKARALNRGLAVAQGEIVVALDADTLFPPDTVAQLARWFADPRVGAVAGNAVVGNRLNLVTRWQALEYVTAQNLERRALAALGAVTVVPGAVGAWRKSALEALGGYPHDTLAEDQDLTIACQRAGWRVEFDSDARAYTEAPDSVAGLLKQRFRWSFGTLQCLWKHRAGLFDRRYPVLGFVALPQIWLFQICLTAVSPLVDLAIIWSLVWALYARAYHPVEWSPDDFLRSVFYWAAFIFLDLSAGALGMALERRAPWKDLVWLPVQRFGYRQLMYYVVVKSISTAIRGGQVGWGKLERRGSAAMEAERRPRAPILGGLRRMLPWRWGSRHAG
ncbi:MAG TPA: glycosyltransferase [Caulobacteraceae bacterium]|jgi:cellulose synthase/poly-beta-1,6-N-acetylglucosamine synthase-like glycosyltransferase/spore germination protein YaaH/peptidoglycan/xylan/chitin deacetylase (PgdA/CDA1 family)|nr:glycosyltransferase [Caulobacteraceae bacterium]